jgi:hypothetical protein
MIFNLVKAEIGHLLVSMVACGIVKDQLNKENGTIFLFESLGLSRSMQAGFLVENVWLNKPEPDL